MAMEVERNGSPGRLCQPEQHALAFVKEDFRMFTPPRRAALPIFTDDNSKSYAGATIAVLAAFSQLHHAITQFIAHHPRRRWRSNRDRRRSWRRAILRRNGDPAVATLLITSLLIVAVAARPRLTLCSNGSPSHPSNDSTYGGPAPAAQRSAYDRAGSTAEEGAADRVLRGSFLHRRGNGNRK